MPLGEVFIYIVIALSSAVVGQITVGRSFGGYAVTAVVSLIVALVAATMARSTSAPEPFKVQMGTRDIPVFWAIVGAGLATLFVSHYR